MTKKYQMILIFSCDWSTGYVRDEHAVGGITSQKFEHDDKEVLEKIAESIGEGMRVQSISVQSVIVEVPKPPEFLGMYKDKPIFKKTPCASDEHFFIEKDSRFNSICVNCGYTKQYLNPLSLGCIASPGDHEWRIELDGVNRCIHCGDEKP